MDVRDVAEALISAKELGFKTSDMRQKLKDTVKFLQSIGRLKI